VAFLIVAPSYFRTLGIPLSRGREFTDGDTAASPPVVMINETLARRFWPRGDAAGSRLLLSGQKNALEVVGVVANSRFAGLRDDTPPTIFVVQAQAAALDFADVASNLTLFVRTERDAASAARDLRPLLAQTGVPVGLVQPLEQLHAQAAAQERVMSILIAAVAALALVISALGLYGVLSLSIAQRTQEIGVRMALGATPGDVVRTTMLQGAALALAGFVAGSVLLVAGRNLLTPLLFGTRVGAPGVWAAVIAFLALTVAAATWLPARRAANVQPALTLRQQ
jgi:putative ABC transport system permease protein